MYVCVWRGGEKKLDNNRNSNSYYLYTLYTQRGGEGVIVAHCVVRLADSETQCIIIVM